MQVSSFANKIWELVQPRIQYIILVKALGAITYSPAYALNGYRSGVIDRGGKGFKSPTNEEPKST